MFTNFDCSAYYVRDKQALTSTFSILPEYLKTPEDHLVNNYRDWGVPLGRRFRALKLWFVLRAFGLEGLRERLRHHCALARRFAGWVDAGPGWRMLAPVPMSVACFRHEPAGMTDEAALAAHNARILDRVNASGQVFLSHTKLGTRYVLRLAVGNVRTREAHVALAWRLLREAAG